MKRPRSTSSARAPPNSPQLLVTRRRPCSLSSLVQRQGASWLLVIVFFSCELTSVCSTLGDVITRLAALRIHRLFIVDEHKKPIGVLSLRDVIAVIVQTFY